MIVLPIHRGITTREEDLYTSYVFVKNGYAFIHNINSTFVYNLRDNFVSEFDEEVLEYLDNKFLNVKYWEALSIGTEVFVLDDYLEITSSGKKELIYYIEPSFVRGPEFDRKRFYDGIDSMISKSDVYSPTLEVSIPFATLERFARASSMSKSDRFVFAMNGSDKFIKVFINSRTGLFAIIAPVYSDVEDMFKREPIKDYLIHSMRIKSGDTTSYIRKLEKVEDKEVEDDLNMEIDFN